VTREWDSRDDGSSGIDLTCDRCCRTLPVETMTELPVGWGEYGAPPQEDSRHHCSDCLDTVRSRYPVTGQVRQAQAAWYREGDSE
jgi:hypothetical protein